MKGCAVEETGVKAGKVVKESSDSEFRAALGTATSGRLILAPGAGGVQIEADEGLPDLCRAHFEGCVPAVRAEAGVVTIRYRMLPRLDWLGHHREPRATIRLRGGMPWEIELRGSLSRLAADLAGLYLRSLDLNSDAGEAEIRLPEPLGTVYVQANGRLGALVLTRPDGVALRIQVSGGGARLACDGRMLATTGNGVQWQTADYAAADCRYDVRVSGLAGDLTVGTW
jgi:hypothetical protein